MAGTVQHELSVAEREVGYVEGGGSDGRSGNITKFWAELDPGLQGQPWCACFVRWVCKHAGTPMLPISNPYFCPTIVTYARQHGLWKSKGSPGDFALFDFTGQGVAEHIGIVRKRKLFGRSYLTVEGNTSSSDYGSQNNGGGVYNRERSKSLIMGFLDYSKLLEHARTHGGAAPRNPVKHNPNPVPKRNLAHGAKGSDVMWVQWAVGVPVDGVFGAQTDHAVREFQRYHHLTVDGVVGAKTRAALAAVTH